MSTRFDDPSISAEQRKKLKNNVSEILGVSDALIPSKV